MDSIVALATPPGRSAIALVRISGPDARQLVGSLSGGADLRPRHSTLLTLADSVTGETIDQCLVHWFPGPASYTGEDLCEISCHGSPLLVGRLMDSLLSRGARLAEPGEFTLRAFLNGKLDLAQAEAVRDLVEARTEYQARVAREQLAGRLSQALQPLKERLIGVISFLETAVEFVEDDVGEISRAHQAEVLAKLAGELQQMADTFHFGRFVHDGFRLALIGRANVGKSSLFNRLLNAERAIVTDIPGTTRDAISEHFEFGGIPVRLTDTAGIREAMDRVEQIGIERSHQAAAEADILLVVLDAAAPDEPGEPREDWALLKRAAEQPAIVVWNKADLISSDRRSHLESRSLETAGQELQAAPEFLVSALTGEGIEELRNGVSEMLGGDVATGGQGILVTNLRHHDCMRRACASMLEGVAALQQNMSEEFALFHIRLGLQTLGEITGETAVEDILDRIFATFCIGK